MRGMFPLLAHALPMQQGMLAAEEGTWDRMKDVLLYHGPSPPTTPSSHARAADGKLFSQWVKLAPSQGNNFTAVTDIPKMNQSIQIAHQAGPES